MVLLGAGLLKGKVMPGWLGWFTILFGLIAMGIILFIPEYYESYKPMFHVKALWLLVMGGILLKNGLNNAEKATA
jgi:hypothetical protein